MRKNRSRRSVRAISPRLWLRLLVPLALGAALFWYLRDLSAPTLSLAPDSSPLPKGGLSLTAADSNSGLGHIRVLARQNGKEMIVVDKVLNGEPSIVLDRLLAEAPLADGPVELAVELRDRAPFPFGKGNRTEKSVTYSVDRRPPRIDLLSGVTPIWQGGAATIAYRVDEATARSGIESGVLFIPGYRQPSGVYLCVVPFPAGETAATYRPRLVAVDPAGNETRVAPGLQMLSRAFPSAKIPVTDAFISDKTEEFQQSAPGLTGIDLFLKVNREVRAANRKKLIELGQKSAAAPLWSEPMLRMPRAKTTGAYAESRDYFYNNRVVDHQTHLGTDLASTAQAPILAANPGKVVLAGYFGIYGGCVIIDHGLGVQTLYGHLSAIETEVGNTVSRGEPIGRSGKTGMSGGDHLHFEVLVGGVPVRPEEWMEKGWIQTYIVGPMAAK